MPSAARYKPTSPGMQRMLVLAGVLVLISGFQLFVLSEMTDQFFAWTIRPPLTAAFLGGAYWASCAIELLAARRAIWAQARIAVPAVLLFTSLTLVVTLVHLDRFHLASDILSARMAAWVWLLIYLLVPLLLGVLLVRQLRLPGGDPPRQAALAGWVRAVLGLLAGVLIPSGLLLLLVPQLVLSFWPWALTPLTARAIGAWLLALGVANMQAIYENDWSRLQPAALAYLVFGALQLVALARYPAEVAWASPVTWAYLVFLLSTLFGGLYAWLQAARLSIIDGMGPALGNGRR